MNTTAQKIVCPPWCQVDHDAIAARRAEEDQRLLDRDRTLDLSPEPDEIVDFHRFVPFNTPALSVALLEPVYADGRPGRANVQVDAKPDLVMLDADGVRQLAVALLNAADRLDEATSR